MTWHFTSKIARSAIHCSCSSSTSSPTIMRSTARISSLEIDPSPFKSYMRNANANFLIRLLGEGSSIPPGRDPPTLSLTGRKMTMVFKNWLKRIFIILLALLRQKRECYGFIMMKIPRVKVSRKISAVQNFFINKQSCSTLNQHWMSTVHYLKISEQRCAALKTLFPRVKKKQGWTALFQSWFSLNQRCSALVKIHHILDWNFRKQSHSHGFSTLWAHFLLRIPYSSCSSDIQATPSHGVVKIRLFHKNLAGKSFPATWLL